MAHYIHKTLIMLLIVLSFGVNKIMALNYEGIVLENVDANDLNLVINHILDKIEIKDPVTLATYDMNMDGIINGTDLNILIDIALGKRIDTREMRRTGIFKIDDVSFKMIKVEGGTMDMGLMGEQTVGDFWIMETEMTNNLAVAISAKAGLEIADSWYKVLTYPYYYNPDRHIRVRDKNTGEDIKSSLSNQVWNWPCNFSHPVIMRSYIKALSNYFGCGFRLPTVEEWVYAAKGGNKSRGYKYSGSNSINQVAWYYNNSTLTDSVSWNIYSEYQAYWSYHYLYNDTVYYGRYCFDEYYFPSRIHCKPVKGKQKNELGIYGMSGNAAEVAVIDKSPFSYENGRYLMLGGSVRSGEKECEIGVAYEPEQCALQYRFTPDPGVKRVYGVYGEYDYPFPCTTTGWQEYLAVGLRLVMTADPEPEASPVVTVEPGVIKSNTVASTTAVNESIEKQSLNSENIQP